MATIKHTATLLAAGTFVDDGQLRQSVREGWRIGVDGGAARLLAMEIVPDFVLGDFDSLTAEARNNLIARGAVIVPTLDQNYTDLDKALSYCIEILKVAEIGIFGATGGRLDHTLAALSALVKYGRRADIRLMDEIGEARLVIGTLSLTGSDLIGRTLSLIPQGLAQNVWCEGVRWPLYGEALGPEGRDGTSNVVTEEQVNIHVESGNLLVYLHHRPIHAAV